MIEMRIIILQDVAVLRTKRPGNVLFTQQIFKDEDKTCITCMDAEDIETIYSQLKTNAIALHADTEDLQQFERR